MMVWMGFPKSMMGIMRTPTTTKIIWTILWPGYIYVS